MSLTLLEKVTLGISGLTAVGIGGFIVVAPHAFYASYGITLGDNASLFSELRAPAAGLITLSILMLTGIWRTAVAQLGVAASLIVFLAFPAGRLIGVAVDGMQSGGIIGALVLEIAIAILWILALSWCAHYFSRSLGTEAATTPASRRAAFPRSVMSVIKTN